MDLNDVRLQFFNVVVVYESIDLLSISRDQVREIGQGLPQPLLTDIPGEILLVVYRDSRIHCQFDRRRLTLQAQEPEERLIETDTVPSMLHRAIAAMRHPRAVQAFGLNYTVTGRLEGPVPVGAHLRDRFLADSNGTARALQGSLDGASVRLNYSYPAFRSTNTLSLEQGNDQSTLLCTLNVHLEPSDVPEAPKLQRLLSDGHSHLRETLARL